MICYEITIFNKERKHFLTFDVTTEQKAKEIYFVLKEVLPAFQIKVVCWTTTSTDLNW